MALTPQEEAELASLQHEAQGLSPSEEAELAALQGEAGTAPKTLKEKLMGALQTGVKGLDYAGGATRGAVGVELGLVKPEEYRKALKFQGTFPNSDELLKRAGVPEGAHMSDYLGSLYEDVPAGSGDHVVDSWMKPNKGGMLDFSAPRHGRHAPRYGKRPFDLPLHGPSRRGQRGGQGHAQGRDQNPGPKKPWRFPAPLARP
jgi:hypothetical protein